ncbi:hypothetical protein [Neorhizobium sp. NCHU2750]|uniref:hypothetical protein n=1 Tax=Neorhizobium sp. NCHU2750 TaxID=1825976 RepID=UPI0013C531D7
MDSADTVSAQFTIRGEGRREGSGPNIKCGAHRPDTGSLPSQAWHDTAAIEKSHKTMPSPALLICDSPVFHFCAANIIVTKILEAPVSGPLSQTEEF